jgi:hypothetical protein
MIACSIGGLLLLGVGYKRNNRNLMLAGGIALWASGGLLNLVKSIWVSPS